MKETITALKVIIAFTIITGIVYPLAMTGIAKAAFTKKSEGSIVYVNGKAAASALIGQEFRSAGYFHGRPSAVSYDAKSSGATNAGPMNPDLLKAAAERAKTFREKNGLAPESPVPADMVLASGSGLDPQISLDSALIQLPRIARERGLKETHLRVIVHRYTERRYFGIFGDPMVNIMKLNAALDAGK